MRWLTRPNSDTARSSSEVRPSAVRNARTSGALKGDRWIHRSRSVAETTHLGKLLGRTLQGGEILALHGDLGTGKTALIRGIAVGLGSPPERVSSPTFVLVHEYPGRLTLVHADLYRIEKTALSDLGLEDYFNHHTVVAIEWADRARSALPSDILEITLSHVDEMTRIIALHASGPQSHKLLDRLFKRHREGIGTAGRGASNPVRRPASAAQVSTRHTPPKRTRKS